jgi:hypothetical protein
MVLPSFRVRAGPHREPDGDAYRQAQAEIVRGRTDGDTQSHTDGGPEADTGSGRRLALPSLMIALGFPSS